MSGNRFDVVVVGAGMVGATVALGFARKNLQVALVEPFVPSPFESEQAPDARVSAISLASETLMQNLGAWQNVLAMRCLPYRRLSVWETASGKTSFDSRDSGYAHMGHMVENRILQLALHQELRQLDHVHWFKQAELVDEFAGEIKLDNNLSVANLIVAADGANSAVRSKAGIGTQGWQYGQSVLSVTVQCADSNEYRDTSDMTWQAFHPTGPRAFLPMYERFASLIWYDAPQKIQQLQNLESASLKEQIRTHFPDNLPDFTIVNTAAFPLTRMHAQRYVQGKLALVGDSAHTINPLAGQGVNLGFKDAEALVNGLSDVLLANAVMTSETTEGEEGLSQQDEKSNEGLASQGENLNKALLQYQKQRKHQNLMMMSAMDALYLTFSNDLHPVKLLRNIGLATAGKAGWAKNYVMKYAMGMM